MNLYVHISYKYRVNKLQGECTIPGKYKEKNPHNSRFLSFMLSR